MIPTLFCPFETFFWELCLKLTCVIVLVTRASGEVEMGSSSTKLPFAGNGRGLWNIQGVQRKERQSRGGFSSDIRLYSLCITP